MVRSIIALSVLGAMSACVPSAPQPATAGPPELVRSQTPKPPFPYRVEEVSFESAPGVRLAGTLTTPQGNGPHPAVVLVAGSGPHDRDGGGGSWTPLWVIADHLARHGIVALRYDKRGNDQSTGNYANATTVDFANDAEAAVKFLQGRPRISRDRVGILGHSEGGVIAPMVAARSRDVAFIVLLAAPGIPGDSLILLQRAAIVRAGGGSPDLDWDLAANRRAFAAMRTARDSADIDARLLAVQKELLSELPPSERAAANRRLDQGRPRLLSPWWRFLSSYDPRPALGRVQVPVLVITGTLDLQVPLEPNLPEIEAALKAGGNRDYQVIAMPGINHLFQRATTGHPEEYDTLPDIVSPDALEVITNWITVHTQRAQTP